MTDKAVEITCPACKHTDERLEKALELFLVGCTACGCIWQHWLMAEREKREKEMRVYKYVTKWWRSQR